GLADPAGPIPIGTRAGVRVAAVRDDGRIGVGMGEVALLGPTHVTVEGRRHDAVRASVGNPHAVVFVDDLAAAGALLEAPVYDPAAFPEGVNVEFVVRTGERAVAIRVHERGSGETRSCGTGACAAAAAFVARSGLDRPVGVEVRVPGCRLEVLMHEDGRADLIGPAVLVAEGVWPLG